MKWKTKVDPEKTALLACKVGQILLGDVVNIYLHHQQHQSRILTGSQFSSKASSIVSGLSKLSLHKPITVSRLTCNVFLRSLLLRHTSDGTENWKRHCRLYQGMENGPPPWQMNVSSIFYERNEQKGICLYLVSWICTKRLSHVGTRHTFSKDSPGFLALAPGVITTASSRGGLGCCFSVWWPLFLHGKRKMGSGAASHVWMLRCCANCYLELVQIIASGSFLFVHRIFKFENFMKAFR